MFTLSKQLSRGFTLIEVLVVTFLVTIIFLGIFGGFQLAMRATAQSRSEAVGLYLASEKIEEVRNFPYEQINSFQENIIRDGVDYSIDVIVEIIDDCADGTIEGLDCDGNPVDIDIVPNDYKKVQVRVFWSELWGGEKTLSTYISSGRLETGEGMGGLRILISDSGGNLLSIDSVDQFSPCPLSSIHIQNVNTELDQCFGTSPSQPGMRLLILEASPTSDDYKIRVQKQGYSFNETFCAGDVYNGFIVVNPLQKNPTINESEVYSITFIIDEISDINVITATPWGGGNFFDNFLNQEKILEINNLETLDKKVSLLESSPGVYYNSGFLISKETEPQNITSWYQFSWHDFQDPETNIFYQIIAATSSEWFLIPDSDLLGNESGFSVTPVDISSLDIEKYPKLKARANFSTVDTTKTPFLYEWQISWKDGEATPISNVQLSVRGEKIVGTDSGEAPIYKYMEATTTNSQGEKLFSNMETDNYYFSNFSKNNNPLYLNAALSPLPINLSAGTSTEAWLYLEAENSLLLVLQDAETGLPVFGASAELSNLSINYNQIQNTNENGEILFIPLENSADYTLIINAQNYNGKTISLSIDGEALRYISLERYE